MTAMGRHLHSAQRPGNRNAAADRAAVDAAWHVLEAANELGDETTVAACRRIIDASLNGVGADNADLQRVADYFR
ncbi:hypothetical protein BRAD285_4564 [Bradyrhizobium sp. ORS 285]|uniref:hypothetical protein n=1 Tax=Bradyrhizobium sp. ORS 285 TaxID=115808 RepID=UPI0002408A5D|nr:hypothetical protein [Bradyrhizobium sp. ORS 285]CCD89169.1 hypothetical protein BRAO285_570018 [Bradyrhizobium sp. ORS 285]SMX59424.1 hypothetical protein BRAD285_4564 [Bradyrhizobium sp. ORS 285]